MTNESRPGFVSLDDYLALPRDKNTWLVNPLIPVGGAALIYAPSKVGKSYLAIQLALALSGQTNDWLGFPVGKQGKVLYLQLDTPRSVWAERFDVLIKHYGLHYDSNLLLADRDTIEHFPFDILDPGHVHYLRKIVSAHQPVAVILDTLRESNSGDENDSTDSRNVVANLVAATTPAALILINHSRKSNPEVGADLIDDHRGSNYVVGRMDAIIRLTDKRMYYTGRSIEEGHVSIDRHESGFWSLRDDSNEAAIVDNIIADPALTSLCAKARAMSTATSKTEAACKSKIRRLMVKRGLHIEGDVLPGNSGQAPKVVGTQHFALDAV